jgi:dTDP-4-amino-4,6-dideoxygalactose transaminase
VLDDGIDRLEVMRGMLRDEIATRRGPTAIHEERAYDGVETAPLPHTEAAARSVLLLPIFPALDDEQQERVAASLARHVARAPVS